MGVNPIWLYPLIVAGGVMQAWGPPMNGALRSALSNPWLASVVSFLPIVAFLAVLSICLPTPLPTARGVGAMPWWAPLGGLSGAVAVVLGLLFVDRVGAGVYAGLTITANLFMSLLVDQFGWFDMPHHTLTLWRALGALLMAAGIVLIAAF
jgi:transporter family-2 protein